MPEIRALVLAAGTGTRLRPLTDALPKPLAPVVGRPVVEHLLRHAADRGVTEAVLNLHHHADQIADYLGSGAELGLELDYAREPKLLGSAGAIRANAPFLRAGGDEFLVLSGDGLHQVALDGLLAAHRAAGATATLTVRRIARPERAAIVELDERGLVRRFVEKPAPRQLFTDLASIGVYCFSTRALDLVPAGASDIARDLIPQLLGARLPIAAFEAAGYWTDIGTAADLTAANLAAAAGEISLRQAQTPRSAEGSATALLPTPGSLIGAGVRITGPAVVGPLATIGEGAEITRAVVLPGAEVRPHRRVHGALFGDPRGVAETWRRLARRRAR